MLDWKKELINDLEVGRTEKYQVVLVEANPEKGFNYSYLMYIPNEPQKTLMMDCLNNYEMPMPDGYTENLEGMEEIYSLFQPDEIIRNNNNISNKKEENKEKTLDRAYYRIEKSFIALQKMIGINKNAPAIVPIIPGYGAQGFNKVVSQLDKDVIEETAPQIRAMIEDARRIIEERTGIRINDRVVTLGHSKSSTFANNFASYYPEICQAAILGGGDFGTLPLDEIILQIVDDEQITDSEEFQIINGKVTKRITKTEFDRIAEEYNLTKREYQKNITLNEDGTYSLPMNFPIGIADIENYRDLSAFPGGKEGYIQSLMSMPKMLFLGEQEDTHPGHFAYVDGKTIEGIPVKAGDDIEPLQEKLGRPLTEIEIASMHNRVLEYISATNTLFGRSSNERIGSYMQLYRLLDMPVQSKIYEGVGHCDFKYSSVVEGLDGIFSNSIYKSKSLKNDISLYYGAADSGVIHQLDNVGSAPQISPIPQLLRRYIASGKDIKFLNSVSQEQMLSALQEYIEAHGELDGRNINRIYDNLSIDKLEIIFKAAEKGAITSDGKNGLADCKQDIGLRLPIAQEAIQAVTAAVHDTDKVIDTTEQMLK